MWGAYQGTALLRRIMAAEYVYLAREMEMSMGKGSGKEGNEGKRRRPSPHGGSAGYKSGDLSVF